MTNVEKALKWWKYRYEMAKDFTDIHWEADERREHREYVEVLATTIEALEKAEEYEWHDLRKNPNDLPEFGVEVLIRFYNRSHGVHYRGLAWIYDEENKKWNFPEGQNIKIIAWKYIEPFKKDKI